MVPRGSSLPADRACRGKPIVSGGKIKIGSEVIKRQSLLQSVPKEIFPEFSAAGCSQNEPLFSVFKIRDSYFLLKKIPAKFSVCLECLSRLIDHNSES